MCVCRRFRLFWATMGNGKGKYTNYWTQYHKRPFGPSLGTKGPGAEVSCINEYLDGTTYLNDFCYDGLIKNENMTLDRAEYGRTNLIEDCVTELH